MKEEEKILSIYNREELLRYFEQTEIERIVLQKENKDLKSQLASIKYLNADEVEHIIGSINTNQEKVQAICKLAIPDIDRDKIIKILHEFVVYQMEADNLIHNEAVEYVADEIIKAIRGEK